MTLILSLTDYGKQLYQAEVIQQDCPDDFNITYQYPFGEGYRRQILLRDCISLEIYNYQLKKSIVVEYLDRKHWIEFQFFILIDSPSKNLEFGSGEYFISGSGMAPEHTYSPEKLLREVAVSVHIKPEVFRAFAGDSSGELPKELQHLIRPFDRLTYERYGSQTLAMQSVVQQILQCPYQGITKRMYLETKVWELMTLLVEQEIQINRGSVNSSVVKPPDVERIYYAKEILLKHLDNPPSLIQLARQVGLNDRKLKLGFRSVFGTTVFGYLHDYRMEQAHKLLIERNMNVTQVARTVGYASLSSFNHAFRKKFGVNPKSFHS
ncbi:helix-turn-helix transcriptional regulator [Scytonema sp. NUACC26]|uniref:helix-turn-helix transcriptional regulator n=1 Tax=Scytonema sp. NUACC26 TaxID=3140176 RepID=UPI0034DBA8C8